MIEIAFAAGDVTADAVIVLTQDGGSLSPGAQELDNTTGGAVTRAVAAARAKGKPGERTELLAPANVEANRLVILGVGKGAASSVEKALAAAVRGLLTSGAQSAVLRAEGAGLSPEVIARAALGAMMASYRFDAYRTKLPDEKRPSLTQLTIVCDDPAAVEPHWARQSQVGEGVAFARDFVNAPPNVLYPETFAGALANLEEIGVEVEILGEDEMAKLGMGALLAVGRGSARASRLVVMRWNGGGDAAPIALVGKGVTFDAGGISLKPGPGMEEMKGDMGGAASVAGAMRTLAGRKAKANVVGIVGLVENMPDGQATRPGDILTSMSGQTIEVLNTDAEGRLVLADAMWFCESRYKPQVMIDLATLTGAMIVALAHEYAGLFSNDAGLSDKLRAAGDAVDEPIWPMPMGPAYDKMIDSPNADMKNIGGREAGSITAAQFLKRFVSSAAWAHLDIAPTGWRSKTDDPRQPTWGTGWGVRLLDQYIAENHEA